MSTKIIFVTGTDTGVGKTLLTALLLCHLRSRGERAIALKPFCSGGREDAELLFKLQEGDLTLNEINPFYFPEPVAPLVSARKHKRDVPLRRVLQHIQSMASRVHTVPQTAPLHASPRGSPSRQNFLLIEGSGGLLVPLGEGYTVRDLIVRLGCDVLVVSRNQLGTINHTLLTVQALLHPAPHLTLSASGSKPPAGRTAHPALRIPHSALKVLLMEVSRPDVSSRSNPVMLTAALEPIPLLRLSFLGRRCMSVSALKKAANKLQKILAQLVRPRLSGQRATSARAQGAQ